MKSKFKHPCSKRKYKNKHRGSLKLHNKNKHACQICFKKVKILNLKTHWNLCEFKATRKSNLGKHVKHTHGLAKGLDSCDIATPEFENKNIFYKHKQKYKNCECKLNIRDRQRVVRPT